MHGVWISYLIDHPEYIPQLAQWLFEQWDVILGEKTPEARIEKLKAHMNRDELPIAWVAHASGQLLGTAALRVHDLEGREDLTPWLGGVFVASHFRRQGIGAALCATARMRLGREEYRRCICSRSTSRPGIHAWAGRYLARVFGTSGPVRSCASNCRPPNESMKPRAPNWRAGCAFC
jgi:GNAT superfamily N-acetyltransferase